MNEAQVSKVELSEIADFRGNLSFAEEEQPIPFGIQSVFWTTLTHTHTFTATSRLFLLPLDGRISINKTIDLERPCQAVNIGKGATIELSTKSSEAIVLILSDEKIAAKDQAQSTNDGLSIMPQTRLFSGLQGYFANSGSTLPFDIKRVYFTYQIPEFAIRGGHAHIYTKEIVFPLKGAVEVTVDNNIKQESYQLTKENQGIFLNTGLWRDLRNFKPNSLLLVIASEKYFEPDYIRNYRDFNLKY